MSGVAAAPSFDPLIAEARRRTRRRRAGIALVAAAAAASGWALTRRDAGLPAPAPALQLRAAPAMGVACPRAPNSIACDRIAIQVSLRRPATDVRVTVGGRTALLRHYAGCDTRHYPTFCATTYFGYLQPAGLIDGPLKVVPDGGRVHWTGRHPRWATLTIRARGYAPARRRVELAAGWG